MTSERFYEEKAEASGCYSCKGESPEDHGVPSSDEDAGSKRKRKNPDTYKPKAEKKHAARKKSPGDKKAALDKKPAAKHKQVPKKKLKV